MTTTTVTDPSIIARFNRGPLTTYFIPPTSCLSTLTYVNDPSAVLFVGHWESGGLDPKCYPLGTLSATDLIPHSSWRAYYYSPGLCPSGYITATTFKGSITGYNTILSLGSETSAALCCPSQYAYKEFGHVCSSFASQGYVVPYTNLELSVATTTLSAAEAIRGDGIPILWQSSDLSILEAVITATASSISQGPTSISQPSSPSTVTSNTSVASPPTSASAGLSTGAKAGLGVGISLGVIAILLLSTCIWHFHSKKSRNQRQDSLGAGNDAAMAELTEEQGQREPGELGATERPAEIFTQPVAFHNRHELP